MEKPKREKKQVYPWWAKRKKAIENKIKSLELKNSLSVSQYSREGNEEGFKASSTPVKWKEPINEGEEAVKLSAQQEYVLDKIRQGKNVFYTGNAGTGKTTLLREIRKCAPEGTFVTALTGVAAVQAGGMTLHSFAGIGLGNGSKEDLYGIVLKGKKSNNWRNANVLIIDEVSMLDGKLFDKLEYIARRIRHSEQPFGGLQLVMCGDFFQLPPILKVGETSVNYCFQSKAWEKSLDYSLELTQIYRQSDPKLIKLLNEVRYQCVSAESLELLNYLKRPLTSSDIEPTKLYSHNRSVNDINNRKLALLAGEKKTYHASDHGRSPYVENLSKYVIAMDKLVLKKGAQVMLLKNLTEELINGSRGVVEDFDEEGWPLVKFTNGTLKTITVVDWNLENSSGVVLARRIQVPLKPAWAMTIHKSQGMSIDLLQVDLKQVFSQGQAYVALSRARTIEGLQVLTFDEAKFTTSDAVIKFYKEKIQKAPVPTLDANSSDAVSLSCLNQQISSPEDTMKTPSRKRVAEESACNSAKKRFSSSSNTGVNKSNEAKEMSFLSRKTPTKETSTSYQGENSPGLSSSSNTPHNKTRFQKASEIYSNSPALKKDFQQPVFNEEATDMECLQTSPESTIQKAPPSQDDNSSHAVSPSSQNQQISSPENTSKTPSKKRVAEESVGNSAKKHFPSCSNTDINNSNAAKEIPFLSRKTPSKETSTSHQGENSPSLSSSSNTPNNKTRFQKASEIYSSSPALKKEFQQQVSNEEATDMECLQTSPNTPSSLSFERKRLSQLSSTFNNGDTASCPSNIESVIKQDGRTTLIQSSGQDSQTLLESSSNTELVGSAIAQLPSNKDSIVCQDNQTFRSPSKTESAGQDIPGTNLSPSRTESGGHDAVKNSKIEAKFKRQREKSKKKCSRLFDALKSDDSGNTNEMKDGDPFLEDESKSSERYESKDYVGNATGSAKHHRKGKKSRTVEGNPQNINKSFSSELQGEHVFCKENNSNLDSMLNKNSKSSTLSEDVDKTCPVGKPLSSEDHQSMSSVTGVICKSREQSKIHCSQLFEALKEDNTQSPGSVTPERLQQDTSLPYYLDKNLVDLSADSHPSTSNKLRRLCERISEDMSVINHRRRKNLGYARSSTQEGTGEKRLRNPFRSKIDAPSKKDSSSSNHLSAGKDAFTQTDTISIHRSSDCLCVCKDAITQTDTLSSGHSSDCHSPIYTNPFPSLAVATHRANQTNNLSKVSFSDSSGMFLELKLPSASLAIAELYKVMRMMLCLAAVITSLYVKVFYMQFND